MKAPLVTVIIASFNKASFVARTIESVLRQTFQDYELIIVDDGSTDDTARIAGGFRDPRVRLEALKQNRGANFCRNHGLSLSSGAYVMFLDADDLLAPSCLEQRMKAANRNAQANLLVFSMGVFVKEPGDDPRKWIPRSRHPLRDFLQHRLPWSIVQPLWKRDFLLAVGGFDPEMERLQDVELHTRALLHPGLKLAVIGGDPDCYYRIDAGRSAMSKGVLLGRWVGSALRYCEKFRPLLAANMKKYLWGTVFQTFLHLLHEQKAGRLDEAGFKELKSKIYRYCEDASAGRFRMGLMRGAEAYNIKSAIRVPGINFLIKKLVIG